jgi:tetratricopeptide (TPR) repeat protein
MQPRLSEAITAFQAGQLDRARELAGRELGDNPSSPELHHLLGLIECRSGEPELGIKWLRRAADAEPDNLAFRVMLVRALVDAGKADQALDTAAPQSGSSPAELALWHARAEAADAADKPEIAAEAWEALCSARPNDWRAWANLGDALARLERWPEAAAALRYAWNLNRSERSLQQKLASALAWAGRYDESAEQLRQLLDAGTEDVGIRLTLARLYADLGRNEDAVEQLNKAAHFAVGESGSAIGDVDLIRIALPHRDSSAPISKQEAQSVRELALLLERTSRMDALRNLLLDAEELGIPRDRLGYPAAAVALRDGNGPEAKRLLEIESSASDAVRWHWLMAKIQDALGDCEGAFAAADAMNRSVQDFEGWLRRGADYRRRLRGYEKSITEDWAARLRPLERSQRRSPAFLVGFPRSGTTLLDTFLMGHPDTQVLEEFHMLGAAETVLGNVADLPNRSAAELQQARSAYFTELDRHVEPGVPGLIVDKLPLNMLGLPVIYSLFPEARLIFAQRHPCDAVLSGFMQSFTLNDAMACFLTIEGAADLYDVAMGVFSRARDVLPIAAQSLVYEELVAEPEAALRPLIDFLGLDWRPELLDHRSTAQSRGAIITPSYDQVIQPLSKAPSGRWRRYEKQLAPVLPVLLPWAERLGYPD